MKKSLVAAVGIILLFSGCGHKNIVKHVPKCEIEGTKAPEWVCNGGADMKGGIFAVGSAQKSPLGIGFQRREAIAAARDEIARQIEVRVKNMFKSYLSSTGAGNSQTAERVATSVSKQVAYQVLRGSKVVKTWISPEGTVFVLVGMSGDIKDNIKKAIKTTFKNDEALWQEFKAKKAQDELDSAIEKEFGN